MERKCLDYEHKRVLITAGPTHEPIDPVRFIGNRSSGKMGIALALEAGDRGAKVDLVLGPTSQSCNHDNVTVFHIQTAQQMYNQVALLFPDSDISIFAVAVADYSPKVVSEQKIKSGQGDVIISLAKTRDILREMGSKKTRSQFVVGFALETDNELENAKSKLHRKNMDMIVLNSLNTEGAGFQHDTNQITIIDRDHTITEYELKNKSDVATDILDKIIDAQSS